MDFTLNTTEMAEEELLLLEPLVITEDGDVTEGVAGEEPALVSGAAVRGCGDGSALGRGGDLTGEGKNQEGEAGTTEEENLSKEDEPEEKQNTNDGQSRDNTADGGHESSDDKPAGTEAGELSQNVDGERLNSSEQQLEGAAGREEDPKKAHRLTPDFPEALYDLLCTLQEGRRLNDQRCSFRLEGGMRRRRCHSEPNATKPVNRVVFSSMTSLQKEEFFDLVATAQARRLNDQRAQLERFPTPKPKSRSFRGSLKQLSFVKKPASVPVPKEDLYDMILTTQAQGRLEDQRSRAPGPMDDEDFFSLLLRVQGGRMDEQRTELPRLLKT